MFDSIVLAVIFGGLLFIHMYIRREKSFTCMRYCLVVTKTEALHVAYRLALSRKQLKTEIWCSPPSIMPV
jgi:hypothetical protein